MRVSSRPKPVKRKRKFTRQLCIDALRRFRRVFRKAPLSSHAYWSTVVEAGAQADFPAPRMLWLYFSGMIDAWKKAGIEPDYPRCQNPECGNPIPVKRDSRRRCYIRMWCDACRVMMVALKRQRSSKRKYHYGGEFSWIDDEIRKAHEHPNLFYIRLLRKKILKRHGIDYPKHALQKRARELGFGRVKEPPWSEEEIKLLRKYAWMTPHTLRIKFRAAGFRRTATGIMIKLKRLGARDDTPYWSPNLLAKVMGVDAHSVARWVQEGLIPSEIKQERSPKQGGPLRAVSEIDIYIFLVTQRDLWDARKVEKRWLLAMLIDFPRIHAKELQTRLQERGIELPVPDTDWTRAWYKRKSTGPWAARNHKAKKYDHESNTKLVARPGRRSQPGRSGPRSQSTA